MKWGVSSCQSWTAGSFLSYVVAKKESTRNGSRQRAGAPMWPGMDRDVATQNLKQGNCRTRLVLLTSTRKNLITRTGRERARIARKSLH